LDPRGAAGWRVLEFTGVRKFSPEIKPAQKAENLPKGRSRLFANSLGDVELGPIVEQEGCALAATAGGRKQKDPALRHEHSLEQFFRRRKRSAAPRG
jgi:hypothetical protein